MSLLPLFEWLASTGGSIALVESLYAYPIIESIHVWTLAFFFGLAAVLDLRLLGLILPNVPVSELLERLQKWTFGSFAVMIVSGMLLLYAIPVRTYNSIWFRGKMVLLILAGLNALLFHKGIYQTVSKWDLGALPRRAMLAGACSLVLWSGVIITGRFIAYSWFDCDRQPLPQIVNVLAGCVLEPQGE